MLSGKDKNRKISISEIWDKFNRSEFSKNVSSQILGTGIAQLLPFLATPLLTRILAEEEFALYTSFFAFATIFAMAAGGKYHMAIVLPKQAKEAQKIATLSIYVTCIYAALLLAAFYLSYDVASKNIGKLIYFVPLYVLLFGIWSAYTQLAIREKKFRINATAKVVHAISYIVVAISLGLAKVALIPLVIAKLSGVFSSFLFLFKKSLGTFTFYSFKELKEIANKYIDYPKYGVIPSFLNTISTQAIILFLTWYYTTEDLGHFGLTYMVLSAPLALIGTSYKDVFYQKIAEQFNNLKFKEALRFFRKSSFALLAMGLPVCIVLILFGEDLFSFVFGDSWKRSGLFASILAISFAAKLVVSPLSAIFNASNKLKIASIWQIGYFVSTFATLGISAIYLKLEVIQLFYVYVVHEIIMYALYYALEYQTLVRFVKKGTI